MSSVAISIEPALPLGAQADGIELLIAGIWESVLGVPVADPNEDFFELGGSSLKLIETVEQLGQRLGRTFDTSVVVGGVTVSLLAESVRAALNDTDTK
jgi:hypothetical protein